MEEENRQWFTPMTDEELLRMDAEEYYKEKEEEDKEYF